MTDKQTMPPQPTNAIYRARRARVLKQMPPHAALLLWGVRSADLGDAPMRQHSDFYYLSGCDEPDAALLLRATAAPAQVLFCRQPDRQVTLWRGKHLGVQRATRQLEFAIGYAYDDLGKRLTEFLKDCSHLYYPLGLSQRMDQLVWDLAKRLRESLSRSGIASPRHLIHSDELLAPLRLIKDKEELSLIRQAARISMTAHRQVAHHRHTYQYEHEAEGDLLRCYRRHGAYPAFAPILAAGANACTLHYVRNDAPLAPSQGLLVDSGAEFARYCADVTRSYPPLRDDAAYRAVHKIVHTSLQNACKAATPGARLEEVHLSAVKCLIQELGRLGIIKDSPRDALAKKTYQRYFPHRTSHWIGLDVHDLGNYAGQQLAKGMVFSIEPGLYFAADDTSIAAKWRGLGVRLEDTIMMTARGAENLTADLPYGDD